MLAVDLSGSMHALDFSNGDERLNRLDVIKEVVGKFVRERKGDRIGLVLFGGNAYLRVPLTFDTLSVGKMLDNMQIGEAGDSTAIGDAIGLAVQNLPACAVTRACFAYRWR
jgi:Ca-activated chloride channel family protein